MKSFGKRALTGLALGLGLINPAFGEVNIIKDDFNVTSETTGFDLNNGVNFGINPPEATRLTGTAAEGIRYFQTVTTKPAANYSIATNALMITTNNAIGRFTLSQDGATPFDFGPALGVASATPENPLVYDVRISMRNNATTAARFSFGISTEEGNIDAQDFGLQLFRNAAGNSYYTIAKRFDTNSTGMPDFTTGSPKIGTTANNTAGQAFVAFLIRVTDAGAETDSNYNSRIQVSINNGSTWIYDTATNIVELPNGFRFDAATRYFVFDQAGNSSAEIFYDDFSVTLDPSRVRTWTGGVNSNWENAGNWAEAASPITGDALVFNGTSRQTNNNNRGAANLSSVSSITFNNGGFQLQQNPLTVTDAITNLAGDNRINNALTITNTLHVQTEGSLALNGAVSGSGGIQKTGAGTLVLGGANTYTGSTIVSAGALFVDGTLAPESSLTAASGTTVGGSGSVNGAVTVSGTIAPGNGVGAMSTGSHSWDSAVTYVWEIGNGGADQINASSLVIQASTVTIDVTAVEALTNWNRTTPQTWTLLYSTNGILGFSTEKFTVVDHFSTLNPIGTGTFNVSSDGTSLFLNYVPGEGEIQILGPQTAGLIEFTGAPNTSYTVQYTDSLTAPITWSELTTQNSNAEGQFSYQDPQNPQPATRFYRVLIP